MAKKILLVEDDKDLSFLMNKKLTEEGFQVIMAETGQQALDKVKSESPDLVLLDILLPDIDGLTVLNEIATDEQAKNISVIILSNLADQGSFEQVAAVGDYDYLVKAKTDLNQVVEKIKQRLGV
jgi:two-component system response regulator VicR